ncbi:MAG: glycosyltransferase family 39 protein [bacterium]
MDAINQGSTEDRGEVPKAATWGVLAWGSLAFAFLGIWFRLWELGQQPILGDEMHALKSAAAKTATLGTILAEKGFPDVSIPLALWDYLLLNTVGLSEWGIRLPMLASGILFLLLLHRLVHRQLGQGCAFTATALASLSPILILFSRFARPYMPVTLLSLLALHFWLRHIEGKRLAWGGAVLATTLGAALTPICLPALGSLAVTALALRYFQKRNVGKSRDTGETSRESLRGTLVLLAIAGVIATLTLRQTWQLGTTVLGLAQSVRERGQATHWPAVGMHLIGTSHRWMVFAVAGLAIIGAIRTWLRARPLAWVLTVMIVVQTLAIITLVQWGDRTFSIARYCMVLLPGLLTWTAVGMSAIAGLIGSQLVRGVSRDRVQLGFTSVALLLLLFMGPLPGIFRSHNSFTNFWPTTVKLPASYGSEKRPAWPFFYNALINFPGDLAIMEAPSVSTNKTSIMPYASYQRLHGRRVLLMNRRGPFRHVNMELESTIASDRKGELSLGDASLLVLHKDFVGERDYMHRIRIAQPLNDPRGMEMRQASDKPRTMVADSQLSERAAVILDYCLQDETLQTIYEDRWVRVFSRDPAVLAAGAAWKQE